MPARSSVVNVVFLSVSLKYFPARLRAMKELSRVEKGGFWFGFGGGSGSGNGMIFVCKNQRSVFGEEVLTLTLVKCLVICED